MKELLIILLLIMAGTEIARAYNEFEEPYASRAMRIAGVLNNDADR